VEAQRRNRWLLRGWNCDSKWDCMCIWGMGGYNGEREMSILRLHCTIEVARPWILLNSMLVMPIPSRKLMHS